MWKQFVGYSEGLFGETLGRRTRAIKVAAAFFKATFCRSRMLTVDLVHACGVVVQQLQDDDVVLPRRFSQIVRMPFVSQTNSLLYIYIWPGPSGSQFLDSRCSLLVFHALYELPRFPVFLQDCLDIQIFDCPRK